MCIGSGINAGPPTPRSPSSTKKKTTRRPTVKEEEEEEEEETTTRERLVASLYAKPRTVLARFNAFLDCPSFYPSFSFFGCSTRSIWSISNGGIVSVNRQVTICRL